MHKAHNTTGWWYQPQGVICVMQGGKTKGALAHGGVLVDGRAAGQVPAGLAQDAAHVVAVAAAPAALAARAARVVAAAAERMRRGHAHVQACAHVRGEELRGPEQATRSRAGCAQHSLTSGPADMKERTLSSAVRTLLGVLSGAHAAAAVALLGALSVREHACS